MKIAIAFALFTAGMIPAVSHAEESPIFGHALVKPTTEAQNKVIIGKGYYADLYGYYGNYFAIQAANYGNYGFYFKNYTYYTTAATDAGYAQTYYNYAAYYQKINY